MYKLSRLCSVPAAVGVWLSLCIRSVFGLQMSTMCGCVSVVLVEVVQ